MIGSAAADKVVILDRDGTLVVDYGYLGDPAALKFEPTAADALRWLYRRGYRLVVITNQSGVGRGLFPIERVEAMNARLHAMVEELGVRLERIYYCPHSPDAGCDCRKPALGLMLRAASELSFDPKRAVVIGDKDSDIQFGQGAGAKTILIARGLPVTAGRAKPDVVSQNLLHAARTVTLHEW